MKMRSESQRLYSSSPTRDKDTVSISSFYYKERVRLTLTHMSNPGMSSGMLTMTFDTNHAPQTDSQTDRQADS